ncbi:MAG TPA: Rid family detoxifying hydrolase [Planctomycetota bacterium]
MLGLTPKPRRLDIACSADTVHGLRARPALAASLVLHLLAACQGSASRPPEFFPAPAGPMQTLPFSEAVAANGFLFVSGQIGTLPGKLELAPGGIAAEAKQTLANMQAVLERHGASLRDVVKCTVFLADIAEWPAFNEVYRQFFQAPFPARSALAASGLALQARVEVECIARLPAR